MHNLEFAAVLFDLDGVLVDSIANVEKHWRQWAKEQNLDAEMVIEYAHGRPSIDTIRLLAPQLDASAEAQKIDSNQASDPDGIKQIDGAYQLVSSFTDNHWAIVTSGIRLLATSRLKNAGLPEPKIFVPSDTIKKGKPDPEGYLKAAALLNVDAKHCLVIEDSPAGVTAGLSAGMTVIAVATTYAVDKLAHAHYRIPKLSVLQAGNLIPRNGSKPFVELRIEQVL
jgi:sugar-phosphatase